MALHAADLRKRQMACILLWMAGGPSQLETFDPKPGTEHGGETKAIATAVPGISIAEGWGHTAKVMKDIALVRSMTNKEGNHQRATYQLHTGYVPSATIKHPHLGCSMVSELGESQFDLPHIVSIGGPTIGAGFLGAAIEPFVVQNPQKPPENTQPKVAADRFRRRLGLLERIEGAGFERTGGGDRVRDHKALYRQTARMILSPHMRAFHLDEEPEPLRDAYGRTPFGQGCLLARRLVQAGVTFVEVRSNGWDTHQQNHEKVGKLAEPGRSGVRHPDHRPEAARHARPDPGRLDGRIRPNPQDQRQRRPRPLPQGLQRRPGRRRHQGGPGHRLAPIPTGPDVKDHPVTVPDLLASLCHSLKVDPAKEMMSPIGRPIKIVDGGKHVPTLHLESE